MKAQSRRVDDAKKVAIKEQIYKKGIELQMKEKQMKVILCMN